MGCCGEIRKSLVRVQRKLARTGQAAEADALAQKIHRMDNVSERLHKIASKMPQIVGQRRKPPHGMPSDCEKYYTQCRNNPPSTVADKGADRIEEYCSRTAWQICCQHKHPDHPGCTELGKTPLRGPIPK